MRFGVLLGVLLGDDEGVAELGRVLRAAARLYLEAKRPRTRARRWGLWAAVVAIDLLVDACSAGVLVRTVLVFVRLWRTRRRRRRRAARCRRRWFLSVGLLVLVWSVPPTLSVAGDACCQDVGQWPADGFKRAHANNRIPCGESIHLPTPSSRAPPSRAIRTQGRTPTKVRAALSASAKDRARWPLSDAKMRTMLNAGWPVRQHQMYRGGKARWRRCLRRR